MLVCPKFEAKTIISVERRNVMKDDSHLLPRTREDENPICTDECDLDGSILLLN